MHSSRLTRQSISIFLKNLCLSKFQLQPTNVSRNNEITTKEETETAYDYDKLVNEYYDEANNDSRAENAYHIHKSGKMHAL